jgi:hypothetical protein
MRLGSRFVGAILLSPYLGHDAPTASPRERGWANVGMPRLIGLAILNRLGVRALNGLPVVAFAVDPAAVPDVTPAYSFRLRVNFAPHRDWPRDIAGVRRPLLVLVGTRDELFQANLFAELFAAAPNARVELLANIDHMGITDDPAALSAIATEAVKFAGKSVIGERQLACRRARSASDSFDTIAGKHSCRKAEIVEAFCGLTLLEPLPLDQFTAARCFTQRARRDAHCTFLGSPGMKSCTSPLARLAFTIESGADMQFSSRLLPTGCHTPRDFVPWRFWTPAS